MNGSEDTPVAAYAAALRKVVASYTATGGTQTRSHPSPAI